MHFLVIENSGLHCLSTRECIGFNTFKLLTGKDINWTPRYDTVVKMSRAGGHIRIYDQRFIKDAVYKFEGREYICEITDPDVTVLAARYGIRNLVTKQSEDTKGWEVI